MKMVAGHYLWDQVKKCISISLILLLSAQCLYNLGLISYFQLNRDFIAKVLCINKEEPITMCHGQCFLDKNLYAGEEGSNADARTTDHRTKIEVPVFLIVERGTNPDRAAHVGGGNTPTSDHYSFTFHTAVFHPPAA